jgi:hypothetical protein
METLREQEHSNYDWEQERCCAQCGSIHYLVIDEESHEIFCTPCLKARQARKPRPLEPAQENEDLDFYL